MKFLAPRPVRFRRRVVSDCCTTAKLRLHELACPDDLISNVCVVDAAKEAGNVAERREALNAYVA
jgi:hypothetical protein